MTKEQRMVVVESIRKLLTNDGYREIKTPHLKSKYSFHCRDEFMKNMNINQRRIHDIEYILNNIIDYWDIPYEVITNIFKNPSEHITPFSRNGEPKPIENLNNSEILAAGLFMCGVKHCLETIDYFEIDKSLIGIGITKWSKDSKKDGEFSFILNMYIKNRNDFKYNYWVRCKEDIIDSLHDFRESEIEWD